MPASPGDAQKKSSLDASVPFLTAPAKENDGTKLFPYNSRIVRLKDEDRFQVCLDLRLKKEENETEQNRVPRIGDVTAQFAVFDGHITSLAAKYAEKHWLKCVFEAIEKERENYVNR